MRSSLFPEKIPELILHRSQRSTARYPCIGVLEICWDCFFGFYIEQSRRDCRTVTATGDSSATPGKHG